MRDILKICKFLKDYGLLIKGVPQTIENETNEQRVGFLGMLLGTLSANLLGNMLAVIRAGDGVHRAGWNFLCHLIL